MHISSHFLEEHIEIHSFFFLFFFLLICFSKFGDIYDEDHFIAALEGYVKVVKELPGALMQRYDYNISNIPNFHVQAWSPANYYLGEVLPVLQREGYVTV